MAMTAIPITTAAPTTTGGAVHTVASAPVRSTPTWLSISWDIVTQQHGGSIEVDSEPGEFTEFTIRVPRNGHAAGGSA